MASERVPLGLVRVHIAVSPAEGVFEVEHAHAWCQQSLEDRELGDETYLGAGRSSTRPGGRCRASPSIATGYRRATLGRLAPSLPR